MTANGQASGSSQFSGKVYVITGGTSGVGLAIASKLGRGGAKGLILASRNEEAASKAIESLVSSQDVAKEAVKWVKLDANSWDDNVKAMQFAQDTFGQVDGVIANAGGGSPEMHDFSQIEKPDLTAFDSTYKSILNTVYAAAPFLAKNPSGGAILLSGSESGFGNYSLSWSYGAGKAAVHNLAWSLSDRLAPLKIRIAAVSFGFAETPLTAQVAKILPNGFIPLDRVVDQYIKFLSGHEAKLADIQANSGYVVRIKQPSSIPVIDFGEQWEERTITYVMGKMAEAAKAAGATTGSA